jgi:succinyl-CoA synthetase beta subunit
MLFRNHRIPIPEDFPAGDSEAPYQVESLHALKAAIVTDYAARCPMLKVSFLTGKSTPVFQQVIDVLPGLHIYQVNAIASEMDFPRDHWQAFVDVCMKLYACYASSDAELAEIKPLALTSGGSAVALNGHIVIDEAAMYRQPDLEPFRDTGDESMTERLAREAGLPCVTMPGQIGCLVNGAGLAMATMDVIAYYGADDGIQAASFVQVDSSDTPEQMAKAVSIVLSDVNIKSVVVNIFGGLTRCDDVAASIVIACRQLNTVIPMIVRLQGLNAAEGRRIIENAHLPNITFTDTVNEAAWKAVAAVKRSITNVYPD